MAVHGCARGGPTLYTIPQSLTLAVKSHQGKLHQHVRSTKEKIMTALITIETARDINPPMEKETQNQIFVYHAILEQKIGNNIRQLHRQRPHPIYRRQHGYFHTLRLLLQRHPRNTSKKFEK